MSSGCHQAKRVILREKKSMAIYQVHLDSAFANNYLYSVVFDVKLSEITGVIFRCIFSIRMALAVCEALVMEEEPGQGISISLTVWH